MSKSTKASEKKESSVSKYTAIAPFADKYNIAKKYKIGDDVSHFDESRLKDLVKRKLVKIH